MSSPSHFNCVTLAGTQQLCNPTLDYIVSSAGGRQNLAMGAIILCSTSSAKYRSGYLQPIDIYGPANSLKDNEINKCFQIQCFS